MLSSNSKCFSGCTTISATPPFNSNDDIVLKLRVSERTGVLWVVSTMHTGFADFSAAAQARMHYIASTDSTDEHHHCGTDCEYKGARIENISAALGLHGRYTHMYTVK